MRYITQTFERGLRITATVRNIDIVPTIDLLFDHMICTPISTFQGFLSDNNSHNMEQLHTVGIQRHSAITPSGTLGTYACTSCRN